jgi:hypothetical protein
VALDAVPQDHLAPTSFMTDMGRDELRVSLTDTDRQSMFQGNSAIERLWPQCPRAAGGEAEGIYRSISPSRAIPMARAATPMPTGSFPAHGRSRRAMRIDRRRRVGGPLHAGGGDGGDAPGLSRSTRSTREPAHHHRAAGGQVRTARRRQLSQLNHEDALTLLMLLILGLALGGGAAFGVAQLLGPPPPSGAEAHEEARNHFCIGRVQYSRRSSRRMAGSPATPISMSSSRWMRRRRPR